MYNFIIQKKRKTWPPLMLTMFICLIHSISGQAQFVSLQIGTGTATSTNLPLSTYYGYSYSQQIYTAAELTAAGAIPDAGIQKIRFYFSSGGTTNSSSWSVYIGHSPKTQFSSTTDWEPVDNLTKVFDGTVIFPTQGNWMEITFTSHFEWNGSDNLIVAVDENTPSYSNSHGLWQTTNTTENRSIYYRNDNNNPNPATPPTATERLMAINNIQLDMLKTTPCSGEPEPGATIAATPVLCGSGSSLLSLQNDHLVNSGIEYQWQSSPDGITFEDIAGATGLTYLATLTETTWYRAILTCQDNTGISDPVAVSVREFPNVVVETSNMVYCESSPATLTASGASSYQWTPALGLTTTSGATIQASPAGSQLYTVTGTDAYGCQNQATVRVTAISSFIPLPSESSLVNCSPGVPVTVSISNPQDEGEFEYQLSDISDDVVITWQSAPIFTFTPAHSGNLKYTLQARKKDCNQNSAVGFVNIYYGFSADVTSSSECLEDTTNNKLVVTNSQGANLSETSSQHNFDTAALPIGTTLHGSAAVTDGRLVITPSATSTKGGASIDGPGLDNFRTVEVNFLITADQPISNFGTGGADGVAWSFGDDANFSSSINNGAGSKLRIVFDAAENSTTNGNLRGIYLTYGYNANNQMGPTSFGVLAYSNNLSWKLQTDKQVKILIDENSKLTLTYDGDIIFDHVQLPAAYSQANKSQWKHLFTAFTGGDAMRFAVDEVKIDYAQQEFVYGISQAGSGQPPTSWQASPTFDNLNTSGTYDVFIGSVSDPASCHGQLGTYQFVYPVTTTSSSRSATQDQDEEVTYTNDNCEIIALVSADNGSLDDVTVAVNVLSSTMVHNTQPYVGRYYDITASNNVGGLVTLYFTEAEIDDYNATVASIDNVLFPPIGPLGENLQITAYHATGSGTGPQGYNKDDAEVIIPLSVVHNTISGFWEVKFHTRSFSGFFVHTNLNQSPLPVVLRSLSAINLGATNRIDWLTVKEDTGDEFIVERSANGRQFFKIGTVAARGVANTEYRFIDNEPLPQLNYYRLRVLNKDGSSFLSKIVSARTKNNDLIITTFPNPVDDELTVKLAGGNLTGILILTDASGRLIARQNVTNAENTKFSTKDLAPGIYLLTYQSGNVRKTKKVIKP